MAAGDRTVKIQDIRIDRSGGVILYQAGYQLFVEDGSGNKVYCTGGSVSGTFGTPAAFGSMTGAQMNAAAIALVQTAQASGVPAGTVS